MCRPASRVNTAPKHMRSAPGRCAALPVSLHLSLGLLALAREPPRCAPGFALSLAPSAVRRAVCLCPGARVRDPAPEQTAGRARLHALPWRCRPPPYAPARHSAAADLRALPVGAGGRGAGGKRASSGASLLPPPVRGPALHVYVFVTIVGWGKNTLLDVMLPELRGQEVSSAHFKSRTANPCHPTSVCYTLPTSA
jgi:hypothetical protein